MGKYVISVIYPFLFVFQPFSSQLRFVPDQVAAERASVRAVQSWLPSFEVSATSGSWYHKETWEVEVERYERSLKDPVAISELKQTYAQKATRLPIIMKFSPCLMTWSKSLRDWLSSSSRQNQRLLEILRQDNNWDEHIFRDTPLYSKLLSWKKSTREALTPQEMRRYEPEFKFQVMVLSKKRINASTSETTRLNQTCLRNYWNELNSSGEDSLLPYPDFCKLGIVKVLEKTNTDKSGAIEFARRMSQTKQHGKAVKLELKKNKAICSHIRREMQTVLDERRTQLAQVLGYTLNECTSTSSGYVHPAERITSWFTCRRCVGVSYPMEFREAARHQCRGLVGRHTKEAWCADWFLPDPRAIGAGKECLRVLSGSEATFRFSDLVNIRNYFLCKSCSVPMVLWPDEMIFYHCQRHDSPRFEIISEEDAQKHMRVNLDEARAVTDKVHQNTKHAKKLRHQKSYGCRHCENVERLPLFTYDGLQSHLRAKHDLCFPSFEDIKYIAKS